MWTNNTSFDPLPPSNGGHISFTGPIQNGGINYNNTFQPPIHSARRLFRLPVRISIPQTQEQASACTTISPNYDLGVSSAPAVRFPKNMNSLSPNAGSSWAVASPAAYSIGSADDGKPPSSPCAVKRSGRPPKWGTQKTRQLIRNYLWSGSPLKRTLQFFHSDDYPDKPPLSDDAAKSQTNGAQKKLNRSIRRDPRRYKTVSEDRKELRWRVEPPQRTPRHIERTGQASHANSPERQMTQMTQRSIRSDPLARSSTSFSINSHKAFILLKNLTIKSEPEDPLSRQPSAIQPSDRSTFGAGEPSCPLPGDFLTLDSRVEEHYFSYIPKDRHMSVSFDMIWADIRDETNVWIVPRGLSGKAIAALSHLKKLPLSINLDDTDCFGNTLLHLLAARSDLQEQLILVLESSCVTPDYLKRRNTGGQTFLHILAKEWFSNPIDPSCPFWTLMSHIDAITPDMFWQLAPMRDVYGRTIFHHIKRLVHNPSTASDAIHAIIESKSCDKRVKAQRDAFGSDLVGPKGLIQPPPTYVSASVVPSDGDALPYRDYVPLRDGVDKDQYVVANAAADPDIEDGHGYGALHCLAYSADKYQPMRKRKASEPLYPSRDTSPGDHTASAASPSTCLQVKSPTLSDEPNSDFIRKAGELINLGCSVSHYDRKGRTALMAFIEQLPEDKTIEPILKLLVDAAVAEGMLEARNPDGETALVLAARLGKISAVQTLVAAGANQHVRHARHQYVRSLLQTIHHEMGKRKHDPKVVGPLDTCLKVLAQPETRTLAASDPKAVLFPDAIDEWGVAT